MLNHISLPTHIEDWMIRSLVSSAINNWPVGSSTPHYVDMIAASCGWFRLTLHERMTVNMGGREYEIRRTK